MNNSGYYSFPIVNTIEVTKDKLNHSLSDKLIKFKQKVTGHSLKLHEI